MLIRPAIFLMLLTAPLAGQELATSSAPAASAPADDLFPATASAPASAPAPAAEISTKDSAALLGLARGAMLEYIANRTPAARQPVPPELSDMQDLKFGCAVGIRIDGRLRGQAFSAAGESLPRNVITAALSAMRSPSLPDRVTPELICSAVIEIETIENVGVVSADKPAQYVPGVTGLMLRSQGAEAYSLPSAEYQYGLSAPQAQARCSGQLPQSQRPAARWYTFTSRHFVAYPGGKCVQLFRGKSAISDDFDRTTNILAAAQVGLYLQTHQDKDGCFRSGGVRASLSEHLYAAYVLARLANTTGERYDAMPALKYAHDLAAKADDLTYLQSDPPHDQLRSAALYILASTEAGIKSDDLRDELAKTILARMEMPQLPGRLDGKSTQAAPRVALYIAARALASNDSKVAKMLVDRASAAAPDLATAALWKGWANLGVPQVPPELAIYPCGSGLSDEHGGMCLVNSNTPQTLVTALAVGTLSRKIEQAVIDQDSRGEGVLRGQFHWAQWFCRRMIYQDDEAFFADDPADWVGAVRVSPSAAETNVLSCAAAIEALLAK